MEGKKFIPKIKALLNIPNVVDAGKIYNLNQLKGEFPYLDFKNKDYFQEIFEDVKFNIGDKVRYIGNPTTWENRDISPIKEYKITKVTPQVRNNYLYIYYEITGPYNDNCNITRTVKENEIELVPDRWIVSFSGKKNTEKPDIHQLDLQGYENKIKGTWKEMFVFESFADAESCAKMFATHSMKYIIETCEDDDNLWKDI